MVLTNILQIIGVLLGGAAVYITVAAVLNNIFENQNQPLTSGSNQFLFPWFWRW